MKLEHLGTDLDMVTDLLRARCLKFHSYTVHEIWVEISDSFHENTCLGFMLPYKAHLHDPKTFVPLQGHLTFWMAL